MKPNYLILQKKINIKFKDKKLLEKSLTHKSFDKDHNNEKIEFLGDRVLGLVIAKKLLELYPSEKEGILDKKFASLVNKRKCLEIAKKIELEEYILVLNPKNKKISIEDKIIADCLEALIGAIFLDKGLNFTERFILNLWSEHITASIITQIDAKTKLQEHSLKVLINFSRFISVATSRQVFLFTNEANFLSNIPSFSLGYNSRSFFAITRPNTLSPKNSIFSLLFLES